MLSDDERSERETSDGTDAGLGDCALSGAVSEVELDVSVIGSSDGLLEGAEETDAEEDTREDEDGKAVYAM